MNFKSKICLECGIEFIPTNGQQKYCKGPHTSKCVVCGQIFEYACSPKEKPKTCSRECQTKLQSITSKRKYGVENVSQIPEVKKKISENHKSIEFQNKIKSTCQEKYGVDNPAQAKNVRKKLSQIMKTDEYLSGRRKTCLEKYGVESPTQTYDVIEKRKQTCLEKYGAIGAPKSKSFYEKRLNDESKVNEYLDFKIDPCKYITTKYKNTPSIYTLMEDLGCSETPIYEILSNNNCSDLILHSHSLIEDEVYNFLLESVQGIVVERSNRQIIKPYELDLYLPEYKIGIEINPAATHNSSIGFRGDAPKYYKYHQIKSTLCAEKDIFLFHIFGYEWKQNSKIIKSMILNLLNQNNRSFGARNTYICEITYQECKDFLNENHRQGFSNSKIRIGLRLKSTDELLSVMTFGKLRSTLGYSSNLKSPWELVRFCTCLNTNVSGGASKLFKYFIENYNPEIIVSFSDIAHTKGTLYEKLGFHKIHVTEPNYFWTTDYDTKYLNRVNTQKRNLQKLFPDEILDLSKTEKQIMEEHGFVRTFDCGVIRWEWTSSNF